MFEFIKRVVSSIILIPIALYFIIVGSNLFNFFISVCFVIIGLEWYKMSKDKFHFIFGYFFLIFSFYTIYSLRNNFDQEYIHIMFVVLICVATDIGGYAFGKIFRGPKLTKISPKKTYSGMIGGFVLSIIAILIFNNYVFFYQIENFNQKIIILTLLVSAISQVGDLIISYFKRLSKIKDTGNIIPGHGGLLDRVDGMIFAFPFYYMVIILDTF